jgi:uncharacterized membrane protein YhaH (DUF805 family)
MKRHGVFGGWFTLGGVRGRLSFLFTSIFSYIFFAVILYLIIIFGFLAIFGIAQSDIQLPIPRDYIRYFFYVPCFLVLWIHTCIEVQRLRDIGFNGFYILILVLLAYIFWYQWVRFFVSNAFTNDIGFHWTQIVLLIYFLCLLFVPPSKKDQIKDSKKAIRSDNINQNKDDKRIDPTL